MAEKLGRVICDTLWYLWREDFFIPMVDTDWMAKPKAYRDGSSTLPYLRHGGIYFCPVTAPSRPATTQSLAQASL